MQYTLRKDIVKPKCRRDVNERTENAQCTKHEPPCSCLNNLPQGIVYSFISFYRFILFHTSAYAGVWDMG